MMWAAGKRRTAGDPMGRPYILWRGSGVGDGGGWRATRRVALTFCVEDAVLIDVGGWKLCVQSYRRALRRRRELVTTKTLEKAMAAAAKIGSSRPSMATGMSTML